MQAMPLIGVYSDNDCHPNFTGCYKLRVNNPRIIFLPNEGLNANLSNKGCRPVCLRDPGVGCSPPVVGVVRPILPGTDGNGRVLEGVGEGEIGRAHV